MVENNTKVTITINPSDTNVKYAIVGPDGKIVTAAGGWKQGTGGEISFTGLTPNTEYEVVTVPKDSTPMTNPATFYDGKGTEIKTPGAGFEDVKPGEVSRGGTTITIANTQTGQEYALLDSVGNVIGVWKNSDTGGALTFTSLTVGKKYKIVTQPKSDATPPSFSAPIGGGQAVITAPEAVTNITRDTTTPVTDPATEQITFPTETGKEYAVYEKGGETPVTGGGWTEGGGANNPMTVRGLALDKVYEVRVRIRSNETETTAIANTTEASANMVAKIGNTEYLTLAAAITAATAGQTIELLRIAYEDVTVNKSITVYGGTNQYTTKSITADGDEMLTLRNITFDSIAPEVNITLKKGGKLNLTDTSVVNARVKIDSGTSRIDVNGISSPAITITVGTMSADNGVDGKPHLGQTLVSSTNTTAPLLSKYTLLPIAQGLLAESTYLKLGDKITHAFGITPYEFIVTGTNVFGSSLPDPGKTADGASQMWQITTCTEEPNLVGTYVHASTVIPDKSFIATAVKLTHAHPIEVKIGSTTYYFDDLKEDETAYDTSGSAVSPAIMLGDFWTTGDSTITLYKDITVSAPVTLPSGKTVTLKSDNNGNFTIRASDTFAGGISMIVVPSATILTILRHMPFYRQAQARRI